jgi:hypothetical protein
MADIDSRLTPKEREAGAIGLLEEMRRFYRCGFCGRDPISAFHFEGDHLYGFHLMFTGRIELLESAEVLFGRR